MVATAPLTMLHQHRFAPPLSLLVIALSPFAADAAVACGGLFCSSVSPTPVDQSAEKILFEVRDDGTVTATVEIKYFGNPQDFAWIVPVAGTPEFVEVAKKDELLMLDQATRPNIIPPTATCSNPGFGGSFGCGDFAAPVALQDDALRGGEGEGEGGVNVTNYPSVGPFDQIVVVEGDTPATLMGYLNDNGYQVTDEMAPFIEQYTIEGYKFLATKLRSDAETRDMVPIRFHCPQPNPHIPLRLTAIAAEPEMGFLVFVASTQRYRPANYAEVAIDDQDVQSLFGVSNYFALVSKRVDEAGGRGFVVERAQDAATINAAVGNVFLGTETEQESRIAVNELLQRRPFITRMYSRMNAEEMFEDPFFIPSQLGVDDGNIDLSARTIDQCPPDGVPFPTVPACGTRYCGEGDACAVSDDGVEGCVCRGGHVARSTTSPSGTQDVVCTAIDIDVHGGAGNPCAGVTCGDGECLPVNDRPTCACRDGDVAILNGAGVVTCERISGPVFESDQILWPTPAPLPDDPDSGGCVSAPSPSAGASLLSITLLFGSAVVVRRVLRRRR